MSRAVFLTQTFYVFFFINSIHAFRNALSLLLLTFHSPPFRLILLREFILITHACRFKNKAIFFHLTSFLSICQILPVQTCQCIWDLMSVGRLW